MSRDILIAHSSDVHVDERPGEDGAAGLAAVLEAARQAEADLVLLAGDTFENNRLPVTLLERAAGLIAGAGRQVVLLPGNHDPATPDSAFLRGRFAAVANACVLGVTHDEAVLFPEFELEIWGNPHRDYCDMEPLRAPRPRRSRWQIAAAHGHYEPRPDRATALRPSWLFGDADIAATGADYLALGHWNRAMRVGPATVPAYYSGSPDLARTVNLVRLAAAGGVAVERAPLQLPEAP